MRSIYVALAAIGLGGAALTPHSAAPRAAVIAGVCLLLWLTEAIPLFATTILLWLSMIVLLGPSNPSAFSATPVLSVAINPVMLLFFGGFTLAAAGSKYGVDHYLCNWMTRGSFGKRSGLLLSVMVGTAVLSMWMSNIAAAAMMVASLKPILKREPDDGFQKALLLGVAFAADFGGIGTPIGTGPNLIAMGAIAGTRKLAFIDWMKFGVPIAAVMTGLAFVMLAWRYRVRGRLADESTTSPPLTFNGWLTVIIFSTAVATWVLEPMHHVPSGLTALAVAFTLFATRLLDETDLTRIPWDTLLLIAGGLALGDLFSNSGLAEILMSALKLQALPGWMLIGVLTGICAMVSAVSSNTAAAAALIALAVGMHRGPGLPILIALGASMGVPFVISTPANAMIYREGRLTTKDLLIPGLLLTIAGCMLIWICGPWLLHISGIE